MMASFLEDKERAVRFGIFINIHGRHSEGFEAYGVAAIGELCLMGNIEVPAEKTIDECPALFAVSHPLILTPCTLYLAPCTLLLEPCALNLAPCALNLDPRLPRRGMNLLSISPIASPDSV